ncbi:MAG: hypothetical protein J5685_10450 [Clostridiales bacterium]|nr:hypothetical protein [Clostridiales bacterium]
MDFLRINEFVRRYADDILRYLVMLTGDEKYAEQAFVEVFRETAVSGDLTWDHLKRSADMMYAPSRKLAVNH